MEADYWKDRWAKGQIAFHEGAPNASLVDHWPGLGVAGGARVLVPLCGKTVDMAWLAGQRLDVVGVEVFDGACEAFFAEAGIAAVRAEEPGIVRRAGRGIELLTADFFALGPRELGRVDALYDRGSVVALPPELRPRWAATLERTLVPGARGLVVTFVHDLKDGQPPFSIDHATLSALVPWARVTQIGERDRLGEAHRARGATFAHELAFRLER
jgi:thiopurine S-methyltransferase